MVRFLGNGSFCKKKGGSDTIRFMKELLLFLDIGNTSIAGFEYDPVADKFCDEWKLPTQSWARLTQKPCYRELWIASVVPDVVPPIQALFDIQSHVVDIQMISSIQIDLPNPNQVGIDRVLNAVAAYDKYRSALLILDLGTALTGCFVDDTGVYKGGFIVPGLDIAARALAEHTAKIPKVEVFPEFALFGVTTEQAVRVGLSKGYQHLMNGFIAEYRAEYPGIRVIGTGTGISYLTGLHCDVIEASLIRDGMRLLYKQFLK